MINFFNKKNKEARKDARWDAMARQACMFRAMQ